MSLHPQILELKRRTAGQFLTCKYDPNVAVDYAIRAATPSKDLQYGEIEFYAALFGVKDSYGTVAVRGCFAKSIQERGPKSAGNEKIIHLLYHDKMKPLGSIVEMEEDEIGLRVRAKLDVEAGGKPLEVYVQTKSGTIRQYSYGFDYVWDKMKYDEKTKNILMYECALYETSSITINSSNPAAFTIRSKEDFENAVDALGERAEELLKEVPRASRMELKQLLTEYRTLAERAKPGDAPLPTSKPLISIGGYELGEYINNLK